MNRPRNQWLYSRFFLGVVLLLFSACAADRGSNSNDFSAALLCSVSSSPSDFSVVEYKSLAELWTTSNKLTSDLQRYQRSDPKLARLQPAERTQLAARLQQRQEGLLRVLEAGDARVTSLVFPPDLRIWLESVSSGCVEEQVKLKGKYEMSVVDGDPPEQTQVRHWLRTEDKKRYRLTVFPAFPEEILTRDRVQVTAYRLNQFLFFEQSAIQKTGPSWNANFRLSDEEAYRFGPQPTVILRVKIPEGDPRSEAAVRTEMDQANDYHIENSYGQVNFQGVVNPSHSADIFGPYTISPEMTCTINNRGNYLDDVAARAVSAAASAGVNIADYKRLAIVAPFPACGFYGVADEMIFTIGGVDIAIPVIFVRVMTDFIFAHELGHTFGISHAGYLDCPDPNQPLLGECTTTDLYNKNPFSIMGIFDEYRGHMDARHKEKIGWLDATRILRVNENGSYEVRPIELPGSDVVALKIPRFGLEYLYFELRQPIGFDATLWDSMTEGQGAGGVFDGAFVHYRTANITQTWLLKMYPGQNDPGREEQFWPALLPGETFVDPDTDITVTVDQLDKPAGNPSGSVLHLTVTGFPDPGDTERPSIVVTSPPKNATLQGTISIMATARDNEEVVEARFRVAKAGGGIGNEPDKDYVNLLVDTVQGPGPYEVLLDTTMVPDDVYQLTAIATDSSFNLGITSLLVAIQNGTPIDDDEPPQVSIRTPESGTIIEGNEVQVVVDAGDNVGVSRVELYLVSDPEDVLISDPVAPYDMSVLITRGTHHLQAAAYDAAGNKGTSPPVSIEIHGDIITRPSVAPLTPNVSGGCRVDGNLSGLFWLGLLWAAFHFLVYPRTIFPS